MKYLVSIIIPVFNSETHLEETIKSILDQSYKYWELILVDDGSSDKSIEIAEEYALRDTRIRNLKRPKNRQKGGNVCRNFGFQNANGEYINWFDSDDLMAPSMLEQKVKKLKNSDYEFVVCEGIEFQNSTSNIIRKWNQIHSENPLIDHAFGLINFHTNGPLFKKTFLVENELFDESLQRKQEWEFYTRLLMKFPKYGVVEEPLYYYRNHKESINGRNSNKTLKSRIKADLLVFQTLKKSGVINKVNFYEIRRHFVLKIFAKLNYAIRIKDIKNSFYSLYCFSKLINSTFLQRGLIKLIGKPSILVNLFRVF